MDHQAIIAFATALFAILNPIGGVAIFSGMVADRTEAERRSIAIRAGIAIGVILVVTVWAGEFVLGFFGIGIPSLRVAGGIMITLISLSMLQSNQSAIHDSKNGGRAFASEQDIAVVPLAMPMISGPGAIVTVIVNTHHYTGIESNLEMSAVCVAIAGGNPCVFRSLRYLITLRPMLVTPHHFPRGPNRRNFISNYWPESVSGRAGSTER